MSVKTEFIVRADYNDDDDNEKNNYKFLDSDDFDSTAV